MGGGGNSGELGSEEGEKLGNPANPKFVKKKDFMLHVYKSDLFSFFQFLLMTEHTTPS